MKLICYNIITKNHNIVFEHSQYIYNYVEELNEKPLTIYKKVLIEFLTSKCFYTSCKDKKKIMQCLRYFDEVGVSNELWEALDSIPRDNNYLFTIFDNDEDNTGNLEDLKIATICEEI